MATRRGAADRQSAVLSNITVWNARESLQRPPALDQYAAARGLGGSPDKSRGAARIKGQGVAATRTASARIGSPETPGGAQRRKV